MFKRRLKREIKIALVSVALALPFGYIYTNTYHDFKMAQTQANEPIIKTVEKEVIVEIEVEKSIYELGEELYSVPAYLVKAIERHESADYTSSIYIENNNTYGCKLYNGRWCSYDSTEQSTLELFRTLAFKYQVVDEYYNLNYIVDQFCQDSCENWITEVEWFIDDEKDKAV